MPSTSTVARAVETTAAIAPVVDRRLSVAPMMACTDRHLRYLLRLITRRTLLYTEMVPTAALVHGDRDALLAHDPAEHPVALQLGGSGRDVLAECARIGVGHGYDEINLNVGCPSDRVRAGRFGACLMAEPDLVARCVAAMRAAVDIPVTVKTRIGIDDRDRYEDLVDFVSTVASAGCEIFIIHARKAWLQGLSPRENREIPPLRYEVVRRLKADFPALTIVINGGIQSLDEVPAHLGSVDGVMIGRAASDSPYILAEADRLLFGDPRPPATLDAIVRAYIAYAEERLAAGTPLATLVRPLLGLFRGRPRARLWRRRLSTDTHRRGAGIEVIERALLDTATA